MGTKRHIGEQKGHKWERRGDMRDQKGYACGNEKGKFWKEKGSYKDEKAHMGTKRALVAAKRAHLERKRAHLCVILCGSCFIIGVVSICVLFPSGLVCTIPISEMEEMRVSRFHKCDFVKSRITNVSEFTNSRTNISDFTNSRTTFFLFTNHERHRFPEFTNHFSSFSRIHERKKSQFPLARTPLGGLF